MQTTWIFRCVLLAAASSTAALAQAQAQMQTQGDPQQLLRTRSLAATCAPCHGSAGRTLSGSVVPGLAGLPAPYIAEQMKAFKNGARAATVMHQIAKGYSDAQIEQLAGYFAAQTNEGPR